jgi:hypothetical protein
MNFNGSLIEIYFSSAGKFVPGAAIENLSTLNLFLSTSE